MKPTQEQVIAWAREAGLDEMWDLSPRFVGLLERFSVLAYEAGRKDENEACEDMAKLVAQEIDDTNGTATYIADAIRARREQ